MADSKVSALTEETAPVESDLLYLSDGTNDRKLQLGTLPGLLFDGGSKTAAFTASPNHHYLLDADAGTADRNFVLTLPNTGLSVGDTISWEITTQNVTDDGTSAFAAAPFWCWEVEDNGNTIDGTAYTPITGVSGHGSGKWGLWLDGESMAVRWNGTDWIVVTHKRRLFKGIAYLNTQTTSTPLTNSTWSKIVFDSVEEEVGGWINLTDEDFEIKRAGTYICSGAAGAVNLGADAAVFCRITNGTTLYRTGDSHGLSTGTSNAGGGFPGSTTVAANDRVHAELYHNTGSNLDLLGVSSSMRRTWFALTEQ